MPSNNSGILIGILIGRYPGRLGWLIGPGGWRKPPAELGIALDNGAFGAWLKGHQWDEGAWWDLLVTACKQHAPLWAVVPDVVADREKTIAKWHEWFPIIREKFPHLPLAFAVQDGMTPADVPTEAHTVFIGGSTKWKWDNLEMWTSNFPRVHVARVNTEEALWTADRAGAASCDGTGWLRGGEERMSGLRRYLEMSYKANKRTTALMESIA